MAVSIGSRPVTSGTHFARLSAGVLAGDRGHVHIAGNKIGNAGICLVTRSHNADVASRQVAQCHLVGAKVGQVVIASGQGVDSQIANRPKWPTKGVCWHSSSRSSSTNVSRPKKASNGRIGLNAGSQRGGIDEYVVRVLGGQLKLTSLKGRDAHRVGLCLKINGPRGIQQIIYRQAQTAGVVAASSLGIARKEVHVIGKGHGG